MSEVNFKCTGCGEGLSAPSELYGQMIRCDKCNTKQQVPRILGAQQGYPGNVVVPPQPLTPQHVAPQGDSNHNQFSPEEELPAYEEQVEELEYGKKKKIPVVAFAVIFAVCISGSYAIKSYLDSADTEISVGETEVDRRADILRGQENEKRWIAVKNTYMDALKNEVGVEKAISLLQGYVSDNPNSKFIADADRAVAKLKSVQEEQLKKIAEQKAINEKVEAIVSGLITRSDELLAKGKPERARNLFLDYSGLYTDQVRERAQDQLEIIDEKIQEKEDAVEAAKVAKGNLYALNIVEGIVSKRSLDGVKAFENAADADEYPEIKAVLDDYPKVNETITSFLNSKKGKKLALTIKGNKRGVKISKAEDRKLFYSVELGNKSVDSKINFKDIAFTDRLKMLSSLNKEAVAFYAAVTYLRSGANDKATEHIEESGIFQSAFEAVQSGEKGQ